MLPFYILHDVAKASFVRNHDLVHSEVQFWVVLCLGNRREMFDEPTDLPKLVIAYGSGCWK